MNYLFFSSLTEPSLNQLLSNCKKFEVPSNAFEVATISSFFELLAALNHFVSKKFLKTLKFFSRIFSCNFLRSYRGKNRIEIYDTFNLQFFVTRNKI